MKSKPGRDAGGPSGKSPAESPAGTTAPGPTGGVSSSSSCVCLFGSVLESAIHRVPPRHAPNARGKAHTIFSFRRMSRFRVEWRMYG